MYNCHLLVPDIAASVSILSAHNAASTVAHWEGLALLCVLAYLKETHTLGLAFSKGSGTANGLVGFADLTWPWDFDLSSRRSCTGYLFCLNNHLISWQTVALSMCCAL